MDWQGWAVFGFGASIALTAIMMAAQQLGLSRMSLPLMLGTVFVSAPDRARVVGFFIHLLMGQIFALLYAGAFAYLRLATWWVGALFGLAHGVAALVVVMSLLPGVHPRMASDRAGPELQALLEPPGFLALNYGRATPIVTVIAHIIYGVLLGVSLRTR